MKAEVIYWHKAKIQERFILELKIYKVSRSGKYADGIKFRLYCEDYKTKKHVLIDNHYPKGPHMHINELESEYSYIKEEVLINDFKKLAHEHLGVKL